MLRFVTGGAGFGKSTYLIQRAAELAEKSQKVIFIVPEQYSFESDKKLYKALGSAKFNSILSLSFTSLAKEIFERFGGRSGEYAEDIHKYILMNKTIKQLISSGDLTYYKRQARKSSFISDSLSMIGEFRQCGISPDELGQLSLIDTDETDKLNDLSMIYSAYDYLLTANNLKDSLDDISEAAAVANMNDFFKEYTVIFDEFESFTGDEYELIDTVFAQAEDIYIGLRLENIGNNRYSIFDSVEKTWKSFNELADKYAVKKETTVFDEPKKYKSGDLAFLNRNILRDSISTYGNAENIHIVECRDLYEEAAYVCAGIRKLIKEEGYKYNEIAVISRNLSDYTYILEAAFARYDIPFFMDMEKTASHTFVMQMMMNIVSVMCEPDPETEDILRFIKTLPTDLTVRQVSQLENYCFEWDIQGEDWFKPFVNDEEEKRNYAESLRVQLIEPMNELRRKCHDGSCKDICRCLYDYLYQMKIPLRITDMINELTESGFIFEGKEQKRMWDQLMNTLDAFYNIGGEMTLKEFSELFSSAAGSIKFSLPPQKQDAVHAARAETARLNSPRAVFVLGANEGLFPMSSHSDGLLSDKDRHMFEEHGMRLSRSDDELVSDENLVVYKSLTHASEKLFITYPLSDSKGSGRFPAAVISQIEMMFGNKLKICASDIDITYYSSSRKSAFYNFVQNFGRDTKYINELETVLREDSAYSSRIDYLYKAAEKKDLHVDDTELMRELFTDRLNISATGFESFNCCKFQFFCSKGLKLYPLMKRKIDALSQGNIIHKCLETVISSCKSKEDFDRLTKESISQMTDDCVKAYVDENIGSSLAESLRLKNNIGGIKENIIRTVKHIQNELRQSEFFPVEYEYNINENGRAVLKADNGVEIVLRGFIDRIDMYETDGHKYIRVIDYKSGTKKFDVRDLLYGINMQMLLYLFSVTDGFGKYSGCEPAGVLYMPAREPDYTSERDEEKDVESYINKKYAMNGVVLKDRAVLSAMEKEIAGVYIPAKLTRQDSGSGELMLDKTKSCCFDSSQFKNLKKYIDNCLKDAAKELYEGNVAALPLVMGDKTPCNNCDYFSVCGHDKHDKCREILSDSESAKADRERMIAAISTEKVKLGEKNADNLDNA